MLRVVSISIFFHLWEFLVLFPPLLLIRSFPLLSFSYPTHLLDLLDLFIWFLLTCPWLCACLGGFITAGFPFPPFVASNCNGVVSP